MKIYRNLVNSIAYTLQDIFLKGRYADKAIESLFRKNPKWGSRDRRFVAEGVYDVVRNYRLFAALAGSERNFWFMTAVWMLLEGYEIPAWEEYRDFDARSVLNRHASLLGDPRMAMSCPDWLWERFERELGAETWLREAHALHTRGDVFLRVNTLKAAVPDLMSALAADGIVAETVPGFPSVLRLEKRVNVFQHKLFKEGWFEVQDIGSQQIGEFVDPPKGGVVIDACAGAGGKSLHLAALMSNKGRIVSLDVEEWKLEELRKRANRAGAFNIVTRVVAEPETISALDGTADKVLLDVPCSGTGVLRRNPDTKWKLSESALESTRALQADILNRYSGMVKPGGELIYSTCSILPSENEGQVERFLSERPGFVFAGEKRLLPSAGGDGFYMARLLRREG